MSRPHRSRDGWATVPACRYPWAPGAVRQRIHSNSETVTADHPRCWLCWALALAGGLTDRRPHIIWSALVGSAVQALVNSASAWLVIAFVAGAFARSWRTAAAAGAVACLAELLGYSVTLIWAATPAGAPSHCSGAPAPSREASSWALPAIAVAAGAFIAEGLWVYVHQNHYYDTAVLWFAIAAAILAVLPGDGRRERKSRIRCGVPAPAVPGRTGTVPVDVYERRPCRPQEARRPGDGALP